MAGGVFSVLLYIVSRFPNAGQYAAAAAHVEMDQFNLELESELTPRPLVAPRQRPRADQQPLPLYHLGNV